MPPEAPPAEESRWSWTVVLAAPLALFLPLLLAGRVFLPMLPAGFQPFVGEAEGRAERAFEAANFAQSDRTYQFLTDQTAFREALFDGELPLWEPGWALGTPLYGESIAGLLYPPNWLGLIIRPELAAGPLALLSLVLAGLGLWLFLRRLGLSPVACALGALAYQLGGWGLGNLFYYMKVDAALWCPWAFWAVEGLARGKRGSGFWLSLALALSLLAGMITVGIFVCAATALYALVRFSRVDAPEEHPVRGRLFLRGALFLGLGALGGAAQLLPLAEASELSVRKPGGVEGMTALSLPAVTTLGVCVPELFGAPTEPVPVGGVPAAWWLTPASQAVKAESANALEWNTYAGLAALLLALTGIVARPRRAAFPALLLLGVFGFAQGWPLLTSAYALPGLNVGLPGRMLALAWMLWPWLAALGADAILRGDERARRFLLVVALGATTLLTWIFANHDPERWAHGLEDVIFERYAETHAPTREEIRTRLPLAGRLRAGEQLGRSFALALATALGMLLAAGAGLLRGRRSGLRNTLILLAIIGAVFLFLGSENALDGAGGPAPIFACLALWTGLALLLWRGGLSSAAALLLAVVVGEGLVAGRPHVTGRELAGEAVFPESPAIEALRVAADGGRVLRYDASPSGVEEVLQLARPNLLQAYGIADLTPYVIFPPESYTRLFEALDTRMRHNQGVARLANPALLDHPILDLARVTAILSTRPLEHPRLSERHARADFRVYARSGAFGPVRLVPEAVAATSDEVALQVLVGGPLDLARQTVLHPRDGRPVETAPPRSPGRVERYERVARGRAEIDVVGADGGYLVWHEQFYPGWSVEIDGAPATLLRADQVYSAVALPPGDHRVVFRYAPRSVQLGTAASLLALAGAFLLSRRHA